MFRCCCICGHFLGRPDPVCLKCFDEVFSRTKNYRAKLVVPDYSGLLVKSLLLWSGRTCGREVSHLLRALKGGGFPSFWRRSSEEFLFLAPVERGNRPLVFVPAPSRKESKRDHSMEFAKALSTLSGVPLIDALERVDRGEQKTKNRTERLKTKSVHLKAPFPKGRRVVFIDDVITTGATAKACWKELGRPKHFETWTLACRVTDSLL